MDNESNALREIKVDEVLIKPESEVGSKIIMGIAFATHTYGPNVFYLKTDEYIVDGESIEFVCQNFRHTLFNCNIAKQQKFHVLVECSGWSEEVID